MKGSIRLKLVGLAVFTTATLSGANGWAAVFTNGNFESPALTGSAQVLSPSSGGSADTTTLTGWTCTSSNTNSGTSYTTIIHDGPSYKDSDGTNTVLMNSDGLANVSLFQDFDTTAGQAYTVAFGLAYESGSGAPATTPPSISVLATGGITANYIAPFKVVANTPTPFGAELYTFTASGTTTRLTFSEATSQAGSGTDSPLLDNVVVAATPEPAAMSVLAIAGAATLAGRRRRRTNQG